MNQTRPTGFNALSSRFGPPMAMGIALSFLIYFLIINPHPGFPRSIDFGSWIGTSRIITDGRGAELYNLDLQSKVQKPVYYPFVAPDGLLIYNRLPFFILPFIPLSWLPYNWAYALWMISLFLEWGLSVWLITTQVMKFTLLSGKARLNFFLVSLSFFPIFVAFFMGQTSFLELLILTVYFLCLRDERTLEAGLILSLVCFKPQMVLFFAIPLLVRRSWKGLCGLAAGISVLAILSYGMVGYKGMIDYINLLGQTNRWLCFAGVSPEDHQNLRGLLVSLFLPACKTGAIKFPLGLTLDNINLISTLLAILIFIPLVTAFIKYRKAPIQSPAFSLLFISLSLASILASPYSNPQELTQLLLAVGLIWQSMRLHPNLLPRWFNFNALIVLGIVLGFTIVVQNLLIIKIFILFLLSIYTILVFRLLTQKSDAIALSD